MSLSGAVVLNSIVPIVVTGSSSPTQWDVKVDLSEITPPMGSITALKTHCNGGSYRSELHVQPRFTFTKVGDPPQVRVLDTGLEGIAFVTLTQDDDPPWTSDLSDNLEVSSDICTDFHPGIEDVIGDPSCDCNTTGVRDRCDIEEGISLDCNVNGIPDECEPDEDCQPNGVPDICDIGDGVSQDCNDTTVPDECEVIAPGDFTGDGTVGLDDYVGYSQCAEGPGVLPDPPLTQCVNACLEAFDFDDDDDIDLVDFGAFQRLFPGQ